MRHWEGMLRESVARRYSGATHLWMGSTPDLAYMPPSPDSSGRLRESVRGVTGDCVPRLIHGVAPAGLAAGARVQAVAGGPVAGGAKWLQRAALDRPKVRAGGRRRTMGRCGRATRAGAPARRRPNPSSRAFLRQVPVSRGRRPSAVLDASSPPMICESRLEG